MLKLKAFVGGKVYKKGALSGAVARRSEIPEEQIEFRYEVYGKFKLDERDQGGYDYIWMTVGELLDCDNVGEVELSNARMAFRDAPDEEWPWALG